jgi:MtaA/CmuA family methyltransferase
MNGRNRILGLIDGRPIDRLPCMPITMMFASDLVGARYLDYATDYNVQVAGQLRVAEEFGLDHVSVVSDPCCEAADCGAEITFFDDTPPALEEELALLADKVRLASLPTPDPRVGRRMSNRLRAIEGLAAATGSDRLVEGWVEGPCAEAADLRGIIHLMLDFYDDPGFVRELVDFTVELAIAFGRAQVDAGAEIIGIGDAASSLIGPQTYREFILPAEQRLVDAFHEAGARVRLHICGNTRAILPAIAGLGCDVVDIDSPVPVAEARAVLGPNQVLCGNLDPVRAILNGEPAGIREGLAACRREAGDRFVVGAGCEIPRGTPPENLRALVDYARSAGPTPRDRAA